MLSCSARLAALIGSLRDSGRSAWVDKLFTLRVEETERDGVASSCEGGGTLGVNTACHLLLRFLGIIEQKGWTASVSASRGDNVLPRGSVTRQHPEADY